MGILRLLKLDGTIGQAAIDQLSNLGIFKFLHSNSITHKNVCLGSGSDFTNFSKFDFNLR